MRNAMPVQWIEQAEARQVLAAALFERAPQAPRCGAAGDAASQWLALMRSWLASGSPVEVPLPEVPPASVRRPADCSQSRSRR
jgi:hypothetical protein